MLHFKIRKQIMENQIIKNLIEFPHPITAFITVLDPRGNAALTKLLCMPWQSTRLRLFLTRATSQFVMVSVLSERLLQAKEAMTSTHLL